MAQAIILLCVFVQVGLTIWSIVALGSARIKELKKREIQLAQIAVATDSYPEHIRKLERNVQNQFELPVLFYVGACLSISLGAANWLIAAASVVFAGSRLVHRFIHAGNNRLQNRFKAYLVGLIAVGIMWIGLAFGLLLG